MGEEDAEKEPECQRVIVGQVMIVKTRGAVERCLTRDAYRGLPSRGELTPEMPEMPPEWPLHQEGKANNCACYKNTRALCQKLEVAHSTAT